MTSKHFPTPEEVLTMDQRLAQEGVPVVKRSNQAMLEWLRTPPFYGGSIDLSTIGRWFEEAWKRLHPSVQFDDLPFMYLAVSALGVSYRCDPPIVFGSCSIQLMKLIKITPEESARIYRQAPLDWWDLQHQAADCIDLWLNRLDFRGGETAFKRLSIAVGQLEASARQLVACSADPSFAQSVALIGEMSLKAALSHLGLEDKEVENFQHRLDRAVMRLSELSPHPANDELARVVASLPHYSQSRYEPPDWKMSQAQDFYRRALFVASETMRRLGHHRMADDIRQDSTVPKRLW